MEARLLADCPVPRNPNAFSVICSTGDLGQMKRSLRSVVWPAETAGVDDPAALRAWHPPLTPSWRQTLVQITAGGDIMWHIGIAALP
jgi:hypothetical protein